MALGFLERSIKVKRDIIVSINDVDQIDIDQYEDVLVSMSNIYDSSRVSTDVTVAVTIGRDIKNEYDIEDFIALLRKGVKVYVIMLKCTEEPGENLMALYLRMIQELDIKNIEYTVDSCLYDILSGQGCPRGISRWELSTDGTVRNCPYDPKPTMTFDDEIGANAVINVIQNAKASPCKICVYMPWLKLPDFS